MNHFGQRGIFTFGGQTVPLWLCYVDDTTDSLRVENRYIERVLTTTTPTLLNETYRTTEPNETNRNPTPVTTATIPYIKGDSETIARI